MCLILMALRAHPRYPLVLAVNRDEFHGRPTASAHWWRSGSILAGRDLASGGTWMGITRSGRWAAVTNYRESRPEAGKAPSRGELVSGFLRSAQSPREYLEGVAENGYRYNGFNLLVGGIGSALWWSNRSSQPAAQELAPGVYGLSNQLLDSPWPKVERGKRSLCDVLARRDLPTEALLGLLIDRTVAADETLPDTGVGIEVERMLSPAFIVGSEYGTRTSTALLVDREGEAIMVERSYSPGTTRWEEVRHEFTIEADAEQHA